MKTKSTPTLLTKDLGWSLTTGAKVLDNSQFYEKLNDDPTIEIRHKCINLVSQMPKKGEISDKVAEY